jgi:hypothetical protein
MELVSKFYCNRAITVQSIPTGKVNCNSLGMEKKPPYGMFPFEI